MDSSEARRIAGQWHSGQMSPLYMFASSGATKDGRYTVYDIIRECDQSAREGGNVFGSADDDLALVELATLIVYLQSISDAERAAAERVQVEEVFGLTGGELADTPWLPMDGAPASDIFTPRVWTVTYHYDFPPEYAEREHDYTARTFKTAVHDELFGEMPTVLVDADGTWEKVATYRNSGETQCRYADTDEGSDPTVKLSECPYCETPRGEEHGYIYIGDGWGEVVYRLVETDTETTDMEEGI